MPEEIIYVYYDTVGNNVLSKGIVGQVRDIPLKNIPKNILLIKNDYTNGTYDDYTGFQTIRGQANVISFLKDGLAQPHKVGSWIDFSNIEMLHQLTPVEISEILYIGHAHNYLHSPFYYKLQNNYIYLTMQNGFTKIYYRYLDEFLDHFADAISKRMEKFVNTRKRIFQKEQTVSAFQISDKQEMIRLFREGVCFSFKQMIITDAVYTVPIFIVEDKLATMKTPFSDTEAVGSLTYNKETDVWGLDYDLS